MAREAAPLWRDDAPVRIGVSGCLLGSEVRWDGGHKRDRFLTDGLGAYVEWVPVCPEVELGLGTPREPIRQQMQGDEVRLVGTKSGRDHTAGMQRLAARRVRELERLELCGFIFKKDSPSCGMERVRVWSDAGMPLRNGRGVFAAEVQDRMPALPLEEEGRLNDPTLRENWIERIFAYRRLRSFFSGRFSVGGLVRFHTAHKMQLLAHSESVYRELGRVVASAQGERPSVVRERYMGLFMRGMAGKATRRRHVNVLQHALGHFRKRLDGDDREEVHGLVEDYRVGHVPLVVPITLIRHHVRALGVDYLAGQVYLDPHPKELLLRNHV